MAKRKTVKRTARARKKAKRPARNAARRPKRAHRTKSTDGQRKVAGAIRLMRQRGLSLSKAAQSSGVSPRTVRKLAGSALRRRPSGRYGVRSRDRFGRIVYVLTADGKHEVELTSSREASMVGQHWNAVHAYAARGESTGLSKFEGAQVTGVHGRRYTLLTDLATIERLGNAGEMSFETIYARTR
jgi:hypothetical protein